ncbi:universal stress protein [Halobellus limi]|jgi:nucleotide-binding universal stress UspA family protein|uniref:Universal stress protein n=1 Tax=Halobellus limi TaxID=699433 RepID=A0A1H5TEH0_9EURY|nr:universal stress protein [Halobellus limi]QCC47332.1 universal stress protein [Halobellus limi]SEF61150.1 Nucleotide-binding universal stress protein, UspA family [Halobellus limi]
MPRHVLVPVDGSPQSLQAIGFVSAEWDDVDVTLLHVINPVQAGYRAGVLPSGSEEWYQEAKAEAEEVLDEARSQLEIDGDVETAVDVGRPAATIVEQARELDVDHVVVGSHGRRGVSRLVLGSVAEHVARRSPVPVTIVR